MIAGILPFVVGPDPNQAVCRAILESKAIAVAQYWTPETRTNPAANHILCIDANGRVTKDLQSSETYASIKVSDDHRYVVVNTQRPIPSEESGFVTEVPRYHSDIAVYSPTAKVFSRLSCGFRDGYWKGSELHYFADEEVVISNDGTAWSERKMVDREGLIAEPARLGALIDFPAIRAKATLSYVRDGSHKTFKLAVESPAEVVGLTGTPFFIYVDGISGGVYQLDTDSSSNQKISLPNFEWGAWMSGSKSFAYLPLQRPNGASHFLVRNWTTGKDQKITVPGRSVVQIKAFDSKRVLVSTYVKAAKVQTLYIDLADAKGSRTAVWKKGWSDAPTMSLMYCR